MYCVLFGQENGAFATLWVYWREEQNHDFHPYVAPWCLSQITPNLQWSCSPYMGIPHFKLKKESLQSFTRYEWAKFRKMFFIFLYTLQIILKLVYEIWLKIRTRFGDLKANTRIKFKVNPINIQAVIRNFMHKAKSNFCHAYRVNHFQYQAENWYVVRLNCRAGFKIRWGKYVDIRPNILQSIRPFWKVDGQSLVNVTLDGPEVAKTCV